jgi:hypothetical protein
MYAVPIRDRPRNFGTFVAKVSLLQVDSAFRGLRPLLPVHVAVPGRGCVCAGVPHRHVDHPRLQYDPVGSAGE